MIKKIGACILYASEIEKTFSFYKSAGLPLEKESHGKNDPVHFACELADLHFAIYEAPVKAKLEFKTAGTNMIGFEVTDLEEVMKNLKGHRIISGPESRPWGTRVVIEDPDGRAVEFWDSKSPS